MGVIETYSNYKPPMRVIETYMGVIETYSNYKPPKLKVGLPHPVPMVEMASLASVESADVW